MNANDAVLTQRWVAEPYEGKTNRSGVTDYLDYMSSPHEIMTDDGNLHVAYVDGAALATHLCELHNRTFGDGQDAPARVQGPFESFLRRVIGDADEAARLAHERMSDAPVFREIPFMEGPKYSEESPAPLAEPYPGFRSEREGKLPQRTPGEPTVAADGTPGTVIPGWPEDHMLEAAMGLLASGYSVHDADGWALARNRWMRAYHNLLDAHRDPDAFFKRAVRENAAVNRRRPYLQGDLRLSRAYGPGVQGTSGVEQSIHDGLERLLQELVDRKAAEILARQPARIELSAEGSRRLVSE